MQNNSTTFTPIGYIQTDFKEKFGIPRQSGRSPKSIGRIIFYPEFRNADAIRKIEEFSHLWILFDFSLSHTSKWQPTVRPPRLGGNERVGVFASRSPFRPNGLGLSVVKLVEVKKDKQVSLIVSGADLLDGTPVYDIKPYLPTADKIDDAIGGFADKVNDYKVRVEISDELKNLLPTNLIAPILECLEDDPRPSYQDDGKEYGVTFAGINIRFIVNNGTLTVLSAQKN